MAVFSYSSTKNRDLFYKIGVEVVDPFFLLENKAKTYVFLDHRELGLFREKNTDQTIEAVDIAPLMKQADTIHDEAPFYHRMAFLILSSRGLLKEVIEVPSYFPLDMADHLRSKGIELSVKKPFCPEREYKDEQEAKAIKESIEKTCHAYKRIEEILRASKIRDGRLIYAGAELTSEFLKKEAALVLLERGMMNTEGIIISCGKHAAMPHHPGSGLIYGGQTIVCDLFPVSTETGYFADMTRTYVKGTPSKKAQEMYEAVLKAQGAVLKMAKPGIKASDLHAGCTDILLEAGFDVGDIGFTHGTGHGIGLDIHESPKISSMSDIVLKPGHVFTVEPGLYYPEYGGVRIEDVVCITKDGCRNLTNYPKIFIIP